jgi:transposase
VWPFLGLLLAVVAVAAYSPRRPRAGELLQLSALTVLALMARRNIALFALGAAPVLGVHLWAILEPMLTGRAAERRQVSPRVGRALNLTILAVLALAAALKLTLPLSAQRIEAAIAKQQPVGAIAYLQTSHPPGALFNSYAWGGYLLWRLWPDYRTFVDGRTDLFAGKVLDDYLAAWNATDTWPSVVDEYGIGLALVEQSAPLADVLRTAGWTTLYEDHQAVVLAAPGE